MFFHNELRFVEVVGELTLNYFRFANNLNTVTALFFEV